jgi:hypothetical protein
MIQQSDYWVCIEENEISILRDICPLVFIAAVFAIAKKVENVVFNVCFNKNTNY